MKLIMCFVYLAGAFCWFAWAFDFMPHDQWLVTAAFCLCGLSSTFSALRLIADA
jgi:hypothetical protein